MKKFYALTLSIFFSYLDAQNFEWAKVEGKYAYDYGYGITMDNAGNIYVAGKYEEAAIFSGTTLPYAGNHDIFLAQYSPQGNLNWVRTGGGHDGDYARCITTNKTNRVYIAGEVEGGDATITFPGSTLTLHPKGNNDLFIAAYDLSGNLQWVRQDGDYYSEKANGIALDNSGNIVVCGYFMDTTEFENNYVTSKGDRDMLLAKYSSSGSLLWMKTAGGPGLEEGKSLVCDNSGNIYVAGLYNDGAIFGSTTYTTANTSWGNFSNGYIAKYDPNGNLVWFKPIGEEYLDAAWGITIDSNEKLYVTGEFTSNKFLNNTTYWSNGKEDMFIACYDKNGNCQWINHGGGSSYDRGRGVAVDSSTILVTGQFGLSAMFGSTSVAAADSEDVFVAAFDKNTGNYKWLTTVGGTTDAFEYDGFESGTAICGKSGVAYVTGAVLDNATFGGAHIPCYSRTDAFVAKLSGLVGINESSAANHSLKLYPNPARDALAISSEKSMAGAEIIIYDLVGRPVFCEKLMGNGSVNISTLSPGMYSYSITENKHIIHNGKLIIE